MNEAAKTSIFVFLALAFIAGAIGSRPKLADFQPEEMIGKSLFPQFTDPLGIKSLEIVKLDAAGEQNDFRITEVNGIWSIPSHDNYPADAKDQMGKVAEALTDLKALEVIQPDSGIDSIDFQTQYGVIDPASENVSLGEGVGIKITLGGANNETLVNLIVGKEAARRQPQDLMDEGGANLRYVRIAHQSPVYVVSIDSSQFSTSFDQWIEKNLLDISTLDIKEFFVDEYSFSVEIALTNRGLQEVSNASFIGDLTLSYDGSAVGADKWSLVRWNKFERPNSDYKVQQLAADQELNTDILDSMVSALGDLKIVSVLKKPSGLASVLREGKTFENIELNDSMQESMRETGFWLVDLPDLKGNVQTRKTQLLSNEGDIQIRLKNGIVYHLRFGDLTGTESEITEEDSLANVPVMGVNRYLFITAEFDSSIIPLPELKPMPEILEDAEAEELAQWTQEKEAVERGNQREQERYDAAVESGGRRAAELAARFADWYYVISEDVYRKIHLTQANVFRAKTPDMELPTENEMPWDVNELPEIEEQPLSLSGDHSPDLPEFPIIEIKEE